MSPPRVQGIEAVEEKLVLTGIVAEATCAPLTSNEIVVFERTSAMCCQTPQIAVYEDPTFPAGTTSLAVAAFTSSIDSIDTQQTPMEKGRTSEQKNVGERREVSCASVFEGKFILEGSDQLTCSCVGIQPKLNGKVTLELKQKEGA